MGLFKVKVPGPQTQTCLFSNADMRTQESAFLTKSLRVLTQVVLKSTVSKMTWDSVQDLEIRVLLGLPWWLSGEESACQFRKHGFHP